MLLLLLLRYWILRRRCLLNDHLNCHIHLILIIHHMMRVLKMCLRRNFRNELWLRVRLLRILCFLRKWLLRLGDLCRGFWKEGSGKWKDGCEYGCICHRDDMRRFWSRSCSLLYDLLIYWLIFLIIKKNKFFYLWLVNRII